MKGIQEERGWVRTKQQWARSDTHSTRGWGLGVQACVSWRGKMAKKGSIRCGRRFGGGKDGVFKIQKTKQIHKSNWG